MIRDLNPKAVQVTAHWARTAWLLILGTAGALEVYGVLHPRKHDTLSEATRWLWRTDTVVGAWAFRGFWAAFMLWFGPHIVKVARQEGGR